VNLREGELALDQLMQEFGRRGWCNVLIEGGARLAGSALGTGIVDRLAFFVAPKILGAGIPAIDGMHTRWIRGAPEFTDFTARRVGDDWLLEGRVGKSKRSKKV
jgi:diaminohydroxyphosphoribosylaminopyrimidine deaminase/5-amino-6-(5-phosphoribosylamino)uracil reductase